MTSPTPERGSGRGGVAEVAERCLPEQPVARFEHHGWVDRFPGLVVGVTARGRDFGVTSSGRSSERPDAWQALASTLGFDRVVVPRQVHGTEVIAVDDSSSRGAGHGTPVGATAGTGVANPSRRGVLRVAGTADGLVGDRRGLLLAVTVADCVPVYAVEPGSGALGLFHAGWRGTAAGVAERGIERMEGAFGIRAPDLFVHLGPAICGACYEVGADVMTAFGRGGASGRIDLRAELARRLRELGVAATRITTSRWCTRCRADQFHSHRGSEGTAGRMAAYLGWRRGRPEGP